MMRYRMERPDCARITSRDALIAIQIIINKLQLANILRAVLCRFTKAVTFSDDALKLIPAMMGRRMHRTNLSSSLVGLKPAAKPLDK